MTNIPYTETKWDMPLWERVVQRPCSLWRDYYKKELTPSYKFVVSLGLFYDAGSMSGHIA